ncbi:type 1 glutamine amidotransferase domain-containing protein [Gordonia sp. CPCC 205333]|uniref:type 1 glutamine amidotransferase domain-containing protein n=1 Tax=Gordonia sp. CPCC 205333 TaxID=3140790 RepID=UPI003AF3FC99
MTTVTPLHGRTVAILAAGGVEQVELTEPRMAVEEAGARTVLVSLRAGTIQAMNHDVEKSETFEVDRLVSEVRADEFDALLLPGGTTNPDKLRQDAAAVDFVKQIVEAGKPVGVICHGPWILVEADVVAGRTLTSYPSVRTDIRNAGGNFVDKPVVVDSGLVSSRRPDDLPQFCAKIVEVFAEGAHTG